MRAVQRRALTKNSNVGLKKVSFCAPTKRVNEGLLEWFIEGIDIHFASVALLTRLLSLQARLTVTPTSTSSY